MSFSLTSTANESEAQTGNETIDYCDCVQLRWIPVIKVIHTNRVRNFIEI